MAVRQILLELSEDDFGGPIPADGRFTATGSTSRIAGEDVTLPVVLSRTIVGGDFSSPVELETNDSPYQWYWMLTIRDYEDTPQWRRNVIVPTGVTPIAIGDLPIIDPVTVEAGEEPEAAWWAQLLLRPIIQRVTQAEYDALSPEQQNDPLIFWVIPQLTP